MAANSKVIDYCSFCRKDNHTVEKLIAGPRGIFICNGCVDLCNKILQGEPIPPFTPLDEKNDEEILEYLYPVATTGAEVQGFVFELVNHLRKRQVSWERIGDALGISRQAAWERFSRVTSTHTDG